MERKVMMMVMMDGAMVGITVLGSSPKEDEWNTLENPQPEEAEHFFY
jgi:hypothetical protein